jgi:hypothetical protein
MRVLLYTEREPSRVEKASTPNASLQFIAKEKKDAAEA